MKSEVLVLELNILFPGEGGGGVIYYTVICYVKSEVLNLESNLLFLGGGELIYYMKLEVLESTKQEDINGRIH